MLLPGITDLARITNTLDNRSPDAINTYESNFPRVQPCLPPDVQSFSPGLDAHSFCQSFLKFYASILNSLHSVPITFLLSIISTCHQNFYRIKHSSRCWEFHWHVTHVIAALPCLLRALQPLLWGGSPLCIFRPRTLGLSHSAHSAPRSSSSGLRERTHINTSLMENWN